VLGVARSEQPLHFTSVKIGGFHKFFPRMPQMTADTGKLSVPVCVIRGKKNFCHCCNNKIGLAVGFFIRVYSRLPFEAFAE
jgi:hypothetical protein